MRFESLPQTEAGFRQKVSDEKAIQFSEFFYRTLGNRKSYQQAFDSGWVMVSEKDGGFGGRGGVVGVFSEAKRIDIEWI